MSFESLRISNPGSEDLSRNAYGGARISGIIDRLKQAFGYNAVILKNSSGNYIGQHRDGTQIGSSSTDILRVMNEIDDHANIPDPFRLLIAPDANPYNAGAQDAEATFTKSVVISAYGARIFANVSHTGGIMIKCGTSKDLSVYGLTQDINRLYSNGIGCNLNTVVGHLKMVDITQFNLLNYGIRAGHHTLAQPSTLDVVRYKCSGDGLTNTLQEPILCDSFRRCTIRTADIDYNKSIYLSAKKIYVEDLQTDSTGYAEQNYVTPLLGEHITLKDIRMKGQSITLRPWASVHNDTQYGLAKMITVDGYTNERLAQSYDALRIEPFNDTNLIETLTLKNINLSHGPIKVKAFDQEPIVAGAAHSIIKNLSIENVNIGTFGGNGDILEIDSVDIDNLTIEKAKTPTYSSVAHAPLRVVSDPNNCTILLAQLRGLQPLPNNNLMNAVDAAGGLKTTTVNFVEPLINGMNVIRTSGASGTVTVKFYRNRGVAIFSGNGSTTVFNIPHSIISAPTFARVQARSSDAKGDFYVTTDGTNVIVTYGTAPVSGTNNVSLGWEAAV